jgi:hypothetical protein
MSSQDCLSLAYRQFSIALRMQNNNMVVLSDAYRGIVVMGELT